MGTRMESRIKELETNMKEMKAQGSAMDSKLGSLIQLMEKNENRFDSFVGEIRSVAKGKTLNVEDPPVQPRPFTMPTESLESRRRDAFYPRAELPIFTGEDPIAWIARAERYFAVNGIAQADRASAALVCFDGAALGWLQFRVLNQPFACWEELRDGVIRRFGSIQGRTPQEELITLRQTGTVAEYRDRFEWLAAAAQAKDPAWLKSLFVAGLKEEIRAELLLFGPKTLEDLIYVAQAIENRNLAVKAKDGPTIPAPTPSATKLDSYNPKSAPSRPSTPAGLSPAELIEEEEEDEDSAEEEEEDEDSAEEEEEDEDSGDAGEEDERSRRVPEQKKTDEKGAKVAEQPKKKEGRQERIIQLEKQLDEKKAVQLEIELLRAKLKHIGDEADVEVMNKVELLLKTLREKEGELEDLEALNKTLVVQERQRNDELQDARKELVNGFKDMPINVHIGLKRMGELDSKPFYEAMKRKYNANEADERAAALCSLWEEFLKDPKWHPIKVVNVNGKYQALINEDDEKLKDLKKNYGDEVYKAATAALFEMNEYNPSGMYIISELWNFKESRRATLKEGVAYLLKQCNFYKRKRVTGSGTHWRGHY